jgi:hypothetical protein
MSRQHRPGATRPRPWLPPASRVIPPELQAAAGYERKSRPHLNESGGPNPMIGKSVSKSGGPTEPGAIGARPAW